jgi:ornithine cyclodeaminase/alanine dehydrogenase-like protein (mu-crystallin family)
MKNFFWIPNKQERNVLLGDVLIGAMDEMFQYCPWGHDTAKSQIVVDDVDDARVSVGNDPKAAVGQSEFVRGAAHPQAPTALGEWVRAGSAMDLIDVFEPPMREADAEGVSALDRVSESTAASPKEKFKDEKMMTKSPSLIPTESLEKSWPTLASRYLQ